MPFQNVTKSTLTLVALAVILTQSEIGIIGNINNSKESPYVLR